MVWLNFFPLDILRTAPREASSGSAERMMSVPHRKQGNPPNPFNMQFHQSPSPESRLNQANRQFLQEIGQIAQELHQQAPNQQMRQHAERINQLVQQLQQQQH